MNTHNWLFYTLIISTILSVLLLIRGFIDKNDDNNEIYRTISGISLFLVCLTGWFALGVGFPIKLELIKFEVKCFHTDSIGILQYGDKILISSSKEQDFQEFCIMEMTRIAGFPHFFAKKA